MRRCVTYEVEREPVARRGSTVEYKDYYQIMGVGRDASADDIKRAYRRLARKFHPDVSKEKDAEVRFKEVGEAYEVLRDPEKRAAYDALGTRKPGEEFRPPPDWQFDRGSETDAGVHSDFFEQLFGGLGRGGRASFRSRGFDTAGQVEVTLEEAFRGTERRLSLQRVARRRARPAQPTTQQLNVRIPAGVVDGQQIRVASQGQPGVGGGPRRRPVPRGSTVCRTAGFAPKGATSGSICPSRRGRPRSARRCACRRSVAASISSCRRARRPIGQLRLKGRGLPGTPAGDQFVVLKIMTPPPRETPPTRRSIKQMAAALAMNPRQAMEGSP